MKMKYVGQSRRLPSLAGQLPALLLVAGHSILLVAGLVHPALAGCSECSEATNKQKAQEQPNLACER